MKQIWLKLTDTHDAELWLDTAAIEVVQEVKLDEKHPPAQDAIVPRAWIRTRGGSQHFVQEQHREILTALSEANDLITLAELEDRRAAAGQSLIVPQMEVPRIG